MNLTLRSLRVAMLALFLAVPGMASAAGLIELPDAPMVALLGVAIVLAGLFFTKVWLGVAHVSILGLDADDGHIHRYGAAAKMRAIAFTLLGTAVIVLLSAKTLGQVAPFTGEHGASRAALVFGIVATLWVAAELKWTRAREYAFAFLVGTILTFVLIGFKRSLLDQITHQDPYFMALGLVCVVLLWRLLFGPWPSHIKASVLGTFVFWIAVHMIWVRAPDERVAYLLATLIALIPAVLWCALFLQEHIQRRSLVLLLFFAGMLSTAPILFYDSLVRSGVQLQFFLFRIVPESFTRSSSAFVSGSIAPLSEVRSTLLVTFISFLIVGLIEEVSKYWVTRRSGQAFFSSVDDVMQLSIIAAIGFAFAENVLNPSYFLAFVQQHLLQPDAPQWGAFLGNVMGRSILTSMVHILSTGVMGYFLGLAIFADPLLREAEKDGKEYVVAYTIHRMLRMPEKRVFQTQMILTGLFLATVLHGLFNFLVTLPDILPGRPRTLGDLLGAGADSPLHWFALLLIPSLFYVVGGFWILSALFERKESRKERGVLIATDTFVVEEAIVA